jgi:glutamyl-tRNA(Gln) amidotransferase subunit D
MHVVRITTKGGSYEGVLLPSYGNTLTLKLTNGYNIGIKKSSVIKEEVLGERASEPKQTPHVLQADKPLVSILHLGGTIAAKVDYTTGAAVAQFSPDELLTMFPELRDEARIESKLIRNMQSDHMQPGHYNVVAKAIAAELEKKPKGIIISHGTDTMQYSAAALSFILENVPVPVILVGSQRSSDRGSADAAQNLLAAVHFITHTHWRGVGVCMHKTTNDDTCWVLPGTNVAKMHTARRDAFRPINSTQVADINVKEKTITYFRDAVQSGSFALKLIDPSLKVGMLRMHPGIRASELLHYQGYDGLIIEGTGFGHAPIQVLDEETKENGPIFEAIQQLAKTLPVVMTSQVQYGRVSLQVYTPGRQLQDAGVLGHDCDTIPTTAYMKLWWLLSNHREHVRELMEKNLRGEISERSEANTFLL